ncbi:MAG TPA: SIMPL domain-containing protein, partial [Fimbriimonadaceae bacterium]|nr:SIMPL domain-containing protein [Fimbriimonadaceae bacterium]
MVNALAVVVGLSVVTSTAIQQGGGSAAYGQSRQGALEAVRSAELAKRNIGRDDAGRYIDAAVLMNVEADEYVAVFGVTSEGKTLAEAQAQSEATVRAFGESLKALKVPAANSHVDFVVQNRIYGYEGVSQDTAREVVVGFELKKNISVRYSDKALLEPLVAAAGKTGIFDLVKVDYVVRDSAGVREKLMQEAARLIRRKVEDQERLFGVRVGQFTHVYPVQFSTYFPVELY